MIKITTTTEKEIYLNPTNLVSVNFTKTEIGIWMISTSYWFTISDSDDSGDNILSEDSAAQLKSDIEYFERLY